MVIKSCWKIDQFYYFLVKIHFIVFNIIIQTGVVNIYEDAKQGVESVDWKGMYDSVAQIFNPDQ